MEETNGDSSNNKSFDEHQELPVQFPLPRKSRKAPLQEVVTVRNWKEYLGESVLIIFSVVLALILTEIFNKIHEDRQTVRVLHQLKEELIDNKRLETDQYQYHLQVLKNIDSALRHPEFAKKFMHDGAIDITHTIAPEGVLHHDLNSVAWEIAKQSNAFGGIDIKTYRLLTDIYDNQQRITSSEDKIAVVLLSYESRKPENLRTTLQLVADNYHAWDVDRAPRLLHLYQNAIDELNDY